MIANRAWNNPIDGGASFCSPLCAFAHVCLHVQRLSTLACITLNFHSLQIYPYSMVWHLSRPWSETMVSIPLSTLVAHDCGYPLSRHTCHATRVAADFLDFIAFCRCSTGVALHPLKILVSHLPPLCRQVSHRNLGLKRCRVHGGVAATVAGVTLHSATKLSTGNPRNKEFSGSGAPIFRFGLADPAPKGEG